VAEDRRQTSLDGFWETLTAEQISGIRAVAMDMWDPYIESVREHLPEADGKIVFDKFHVAKHLGDAVDKVRRKENFGRPPMSSMPRAAWPPISGSWTTRCASYSAMWVK
jgi:transposase